MYSQGVKTWKPFSLDTFENRDKISREEAQRERVSERALWRQQNRTFNFIAAWTDRFPINKKEFRFLIPLGAGM